MGYEPRLLSAVEAVNKTQKSFLVDKIRRHFGGDLGGKVIALWGLAFKPNTDDMREAPSLVIIEQLLASGARVRAFDPVAMKEAARVLANRPGVELVHDAHAALEGADALAIVTEWREFRSPDFDRLKAILKQPVIFDGRNLYNPQLMASFGFSYYGVGRGLA